MHGETSTLKGGAANLWNAFCEDLVLKLNEKPSYEREGTGVGKYHIVSREHLLPNAKFVLKDAVKIEQTMIGSYPGCVRIGHHWWNLFPQNLLINSLNLGLLPTGIDRDEPFQNDTKESDKKQQSQQKPILTNNNNNNKFNARLESSFETLMLVTTTNIAPNQPLVIDFGPHVNMLNFARILWLSRHGTFNKTISVSGLPHKNWFYFPQSNFPQQDWLKVQNELFQVNPISPDFQVSSHMFTGAPKPFITRVVLQNQMIVLEQDVNLVNEFIAQNHYPVNASTVSHKYTTRLFIEKEQPSLLASSFSRAKLSFMLPTLC